MVLWDDVCEEVLLDYPGLEVDWALASGMPQRMVLQPWTIDTVLATNLHADVLAGLAVALTGSPGLGASANLDPSRERPSMFEPVQGSDFDIAGKGAANPLGAFWAGCLMLDHLGEQAASERLMEAIETVTALGETLPPDLGGNASTQDVTRAVITAIEDPTA